MDKKMQIAMELVKTGILEISPDGEIWRMFIKGRTGKFKGQWCPTKPKKISKVNKAGYISFPIQSNDGEKTTVRAHRVVYTYFHGEIPEDCEIHHKDNNKTNNHPDNLEAVTHLENQGRAARDGLYQSVVGSKNPSARVDEAMIEKICLLLEDGLDCVATSKKLDIPLSIVHRVTSGKNWRHLECVRNLIYYHRKPRKITKAKPELFAIH